MILPLISAASCLIPSCAIMNLGYRQSVVNVIRYGAELTAQRVLQSVRYSLTSVYRVRVPQLECDGLPYLHSAQRVACHFLLSHIAVILMLVIILFVILLVERKTVVNLRLDIMRLGKLSDSLSSIRLFVLCAQR